MPLVAAPVPRTLIPLVLMSVLAGSPTLTRIAGSQFFTSEAFAKFGSFTLAIIYPRLKRYLSQAAPYRLHLLRSHAAGLILATI